VRIGVLTMEEFRRLKDELVRLLNLKV